MKLRLAIAFLLSGAVAYSQQIGLLEDAIQRPLTQFGKSVGISYFFSEPTDGSDGELGVVVDEEQATAPSVVVWSEATQEWLTLMITQYEDVFWDDIRTPATAVLVGVGAGNSAGRATDGSLLFDTAQDEESFIWTQFPHSRKVGTNIQPHVHWAKTTSATGDVCWRIDYECVDAGETFSGTTTKSMVYAEDDGDTAEKHARAVVEAFDPALSTISGICKFRLWRDVSGDGAACLDDYAADARLLEFDVHYLSDQPGSFNLYTK